MVIKLNFYVENYQKRMNMLKYFDENKCMNSLIKDEELLEAHDKI